MSTLKKIHRRNLPVKIPLFKTITIWLLLDRCNAPIWVWITFAIVALIAWIISGSMFCVEKQIDIFEEKQIVISEKKITESEFLDLLSKISVSNIKHQS